MEDASSHMGLWGWEDLPGWPGWVSNVPMGTEDRSRARRDHRRKSGAEGHLQDGKPAGEDTASLALRVEEELGPREAKAGVLKLGDG